jgi:hypothetical protein
MKILSAIFLPLLVVSSTSAFVVPTTRQQQYYSLVTQRFSSSSTPDAEAAAAAAETTEEVPIIVTGTNIDLTPALVDYVNSKLERPFGKLRSNGAIRDCEVHLSVNKNPKVSVIFFLVEFYVGMYQR